MARTCPSCSTQNIDGARFCRTCGTVLQPSSPSAPTSVVDPTPFRPNYPPAYQSPQPQNQYPNANPTSTMSPIQTAPNYGAPFQQTYNPMFGDPMAVPYAGFWQRWFAYMIDRIVPAIVLVPSYFYFVGTQNPRTGPDPIASVILLLCCFVTFIYVMINIYLLGKNGATIGKSLMGLKCLGPDGQPLGFGKAFLREFVREIMGFCGIVSLIDHLTMLGDVEKQTWHDKIVSSHVFKI